ncbi:amidohydrolase [Paenibacillus spongiae]|uniref:Amidohydrolase n=1 Tax=Paenibacillus spongiae TaxID=2909671 RepID=A0ABY5SKF6_9BACL|nr:amidohydrolase [Paenibacillus spongiae]UVI33078.1 amidohydrolase [Paenibacillus spongiae]
MSNSWLTNVRLEKGYIYEDGAVSGTMTDIYHIRIQDGVIAEIIPADQALTDDLVKVDAKRLLMLPSFKEMHIHIDKTYYSGPWKAVKRVNGIFGRIEEERELLPKLLPTAQHRAESILETILGFGSTHVRTHCNIDPVIGLSNLEATMQALHNFSDKLSYEVVAFPQHGLLRSNAAPLVREAMKHGATFVGGVDPATVDENIEKSLQTIMEIAVASNAGVDIHIHDRGEAGLTTMSRLADMTEDAKWHGRVTVSHAFGFAGIASGTASELAARFAELGMSIASSVPIGGLVMPIPLLHDHGVTVGLGTDSMTDHWSPFGNGDHLEKVGRLAELYGYSDEQSLSQALGYITGGITPLSKEGEQVWPRVGDPANLVFVEASCSAEAVARRARRSATLYNGNLASGAF